MRRQPASMQQQEILITYLATPRASFGSAIGRLTDAQNSGKSKTHRKSEFPELIQDNRGTPGTHQTSFRRTPEAPARLKNAICEKFRFLKKYPSEPPPGDLGASVNPLDLPSRAAWVPRRCWESFFKWGKALSSRIGGRGATSGQNATCNNTSFLVQISSVFIDPGSK